MKKESSYTKERKNEDHPIRPYSTNTFDKTIFSSNYEKEVQSGKMNSLFIIFLYIVFRKLYLTLFSEAAKNEVKWITFYAMKKNEIHKYT